MTAGRATLLQVRLRVSATGTDAVESADEPKPALRERVVAAARVLAGQSNGHWELGDRRGAARRIGAPPIAND